MNLVQPAMRRPLTVVVLIIAVMLIGNYEKLICLLRQCIGMMNKFVCLLRKSVCGFLRIFGKNNKQPRHQNG